MKAGHVEEIEKYRHEAGIAKRQTASTYLKKLAEISVLEEHRLGKEKLFLHPKLMQLLTTNK